MRVLIYESSSFGGCYEYSRYLFEAYKRKAESAVLLLPEGKYGSGEQKGEKRILFNDIPAFKIKIFRKAHFLLRTFVNPFLLFFYLINKKKSVVIFNDFEQLSAPFWVPFFRFFLRRHRFLVVLHDPDRDNYPPSKKISAWCMNKLMSLMDGALYHGHLPEKSYYKQDNCNFINIPHGLYPVAESDREMEEKLINDKGNFIYASILGNIREEKNYELAIRALPSFPELKLVIAGKPASSSVNLKKYYKLAEELKVKDRIIWIIKFLDDEELSALIKVSDIILLNYSKSFTSQSGIVNLIAPFRKPYIYSRTESSLTYTSEKFDLGIPVSPDDLSSLKEGIGKFMNEGADPSGYDRYLKYASWDNQVEIVLKEISS